MMRYYDDEYYYRPRRFRFLVPALVIALLGSGAGYLFANHSILSEARELTEVTEEAVYPQYAEVVRQNIRNIYNVEGTVATAGDVNVNSGIAGSNSSITVAAVNVSIGDHVKAGDVLYTLDTSSVENDLAIQQEKIAIQNQLEAIRSSQSYRALSDAQYNSQNTYESNTKQLQRSAEDVNEDIVEQIILTQDEYLKYIQEEAEKKPVYESLKAQVEELEAKKDAAQAVVDSIDYKLSLAQADSDYLKGKYKIGEEYSEEDAAKIEELRLQINQLTYEKDKQYVTYDELYDSYIAVNKQFSKAETEYNKAKNNKEVAESAYKSGKKIIKMDGRLMEDLVPSVDQSNRSVQNQEQAARENIQSQNLQNQLSKIDTEEELRKKKEMLEKGEITATCDGIVTQINVTPGKAYAGDSAVVISQDGPLHLTSEVSEAAIPDLYIGQQVFVKTDATKDEVLKGKVIFVAPTPTKTTSSSSSSGSTGEFTLGPSTTTSAPKKPTYKVEIKLDQENLRLRVGMTAKLAFVIEEVRNAVAVPAKSIITDLNGNHFVRVASKVSEEEGESVLVREVKVTLGISDGEMTEITSGNLEAGMVVEIASEEESNSYVDELFAGFEE